MSKLQKEDKGLIYIIAFGSFFMFLLIIGGSVL